MTEQTLNPRGVVRRSIQPMVALRALRILFGNPDDTRQVFVIIRSMAGDAFERLYQRVLADPTGNRVLGERRDILTLLQDREGLRALPEGTLGREYARFMDRENISADGLVEASEESDDEEHFLDERAKVLSRRLRDTHDLWHVATGYQRDLFGEGALLAFSWAQTRNRGIAVILLIASLKHLRDGYPGFLRMLWQGWRRGRRAAFFPAADWETLLRTPLDEARRQLRVTDTPDYTPVFSEGALATR